MVRISTGQMAQLLVQALHGGKDTGGSLELKVGSIVRATLLQTLANQEEVWLQIGDTKMRAKLEANLQPGDQVDLLVTGEQKKGALELKMVGQPIRNGETKGQLDPQGLLRALGLPDGDDTKALVREWVARQIPLKPDVLRAASEALKQAGTTTPTPSQVATLGKMAELGIPIQPSTFAAMHTLDSGPKLHELLTNLLGNLQDLLPETEAESASQVSVTNALAKEQPPAAQTATQTGQNATAKGQPAQANLTNRTTPAPAFVSEPADTPAQPTQPGAVPQASVRNEQAAQLALAKPEAEQKANPFPENKIPRPNTTTGDDKSVRSSSSAPVTELHTLSNQTRARLADLASVAKKLLSDADSYGHSLGDQAKRLGLSFEERVGQALRRLPADSDPAMLRNAFDAAVKADSADGPTLKQALLLAQATAPDLEGAGLQGLAQDIGTLLSHVTGQQVMQTAGQERSDLFYQFAAVPVQVSGQQQTVELHVMSRKGPGQKNLDPSNCYILFRLDMPNLGALDVHLHIVDKVVGVRFQSEESKQLEIEPTEQRNLRDALLTAGFHLGVVKVEEKKQLTEGLPMPLLPPLLTQGAFDLKA